MDRRGRASGVLVFLAAVMIVGCGHSAARRSAAQVLEAQASSPSTTIPITPTTAAAAPLRLILGPDGFLVPEGWQATPLRSYGGPASFGSYQQPGGGRGRVDYERDGTGGVYGPDHQPNMQQLAAASNTSDWGAGPLGCPIISHTLPAANQLRYSCRSPSPDLAVTGLLIVDAYPEGFRLLQTTVAVHDQQAADQILASLPG